MYQAVREVTAMSGLRFKIDALVNARGEITDLYAGDPLQAFEVGVEEARIHYGVQPCSGRDVVVANAYAKYNEMAICMLLALAGVNMERGIVVLLVDAPEGQVCHYLMRSFGKDYGGECYVKRGAPPGGVKVIVCSRYPDPTMCDLFAAPGSVIVVKEWEQVLEILEKEYPGEAAVAVIPDGTMQYFREG
jgi:nickel-dependent lactate racemase